MKVLCIGKSNYDITIEVDAKELTGESVKEEKPKEKVEDKIEDKVEDKIEDKTDDKVEDKTEEEVLKIADIVSYLQKMSSAKLPRLEYTS